MGIFETGLFSRIENTFTEYENIKKIDRFKAKKNLI